MNKPEREFRHAPYDIECEQALLGALILHNDLIDQVAADLDAEEFYDPLHRRLYEMIVYLITEGAVTPLVVHAAIKNDPGLIEVGGHAYLAGLVQATPAMPNVKDYVRILSELATRRRLIQIGEDIVNAAYEAPHDLKSGAIIADGVDKLLISNPSQRSVVHNISDVALERLQRAEERLKNGETKGGLPTGIPKMDKALGGGLQPAERLSIAARSGMGKSALAAVMARAAAQEGHPVLIISADMGKDAWVDRQLTEFDYHRRYGEKPIHYSKIRNGTLSNHEIAKLAEAQREMQNWPWEICDEGVIDMATISSRARAMAKKYPNRQGRLILDFLQLIDGKREKNERRDEEITRVWYGAGALVKSIGWDVVGLAQMGNKDTDASGKLRETPPTSAEIRESGGIEQGSDICISFFRKAFFIERREPDGRDDAGGPAPKWLEWQAELSEHRHKGRIVPYKVRGGNIRVLSLDLHVDMGANAICDHVPERPMEEPPDELAF